MYFQTTTFFVLFCFLFFCFFVFLTPIIYLEQLSYDLRPSRKSLYYVRYPPTIYKNIVDIRYEDARNVYDIENDDRWIYKASPLFERATIINIYENETDQFPLEIDFGEHYENSEEGPYDFAKISMVKKITR